MSHEWTAGEGENRLQGVELFRGDPRVGIIRVAAVPAIATLGQLMYLPVYYDLEKRTEGNKRLREHLSVLSELGIDRNMHLNSMLDEFSKNPALSAEAMASQLLPIGDGQVVHKQDVNLLLESFPIDKGPKQTTQSDNIQRRSVQLPPPRLMKFFRQRFVFQAGMIRFHLSQDELQTGIPRP